MVEEKIINPSNFSWNPETKEKIHLEYYKIDSKTRQIIGTEPIKISEDEKKKVVEAARVCSARALGEFAKDVNMKKKSIVKRGRPLKVEEATEVKKVDKK